MEEGRMENATGQSSLVPPEERPRTRTTTTTRTIGQTLNSYRHEVPGYRRKAAPSRRDGRSHCQTQCQQNRFNRPAGTGPFSS